VIDATWMDIPICPSRMKQMIYGIKPKKEETEKQQMIHGVIHHQSYVIVQILKKIIPV
jgi:NADH:ubiquinone oxidoreductase subunit B-like Fe-S oxidoreductase